MYAETGLLFPYFQNFSQEAQQLDEYCKTQKCNASMVLPISLYFGFIHFVGLIDLQCFFYCFFLLVNLMVGELKISCLSSLLGESKVSYGTSELEFDSVAITLGFLFFNE